MKKPRIPIGTAHALAAAAVIAAMPATAVAQGKYPERAIRLVIPFAPGGNTDIVGRRFAAKLTPHLGQQIVVDNKSGASGSIGTAEVARAAPDGYTLVIGTTSTHSLNPLLMAKLAYDPVRDFKSIARNLPELIKRVKSAPGQFSYASCGTGSICHLTGEFFKQQAGGLDMIHVPYRGSGQSVGEVVAGQVPVMAGTFSSMVTHHRSGRLRVLFVCNEKRSDAEPSIASAPEVGFPRMLAYTFAVLGAPVATPASIIAQIAEASDKVMADAGFQKDLAAQTVEPFAGSTPAKADQMVRDELAKWGPIVKASGLKAN